MVSHAVNSTVKNGVKVFKNIISGSNFFNPFASVLHSLRFVIKTCG